MSFLQLLEPYSRGSPSKTNSGQYKFFGGNDSEVGFLNSPHYDTQIQRFTHTNSSARVNCDFSNLSAVGSCMKKLTPRKTPHSPIEDLLQAASKSPSQGDINVHDTEPRVDTTHDDTTYNVTTVRTPSKILCFYRPGHRDLTESRNHSYPVWKERPGAFGETILARHLLQSYS